MRSEFLVLISVACASRAVDFHVSSKQADNLSKALKLDRDWASWKSWMTMEPSHGSHALAMLLLTSHPAAAFNAGSFGHSTHLARAASAMRTQGNAFTIVVTGATGKVGGALVRHLLSKSREMDLNEQGDAASVRVIALVRNAVKARELYGDAIEILEADYTDSDAVGKALGSLDLDQWRMFLACGNIPGQSQAELNLVEAAEAHGCEYVVKLSTVRTVLEKQGGGPYRAHLEVEEGLLSSTKLKYKTVLRPNLFMQMLCAGPLGLGSLVKSGDACEHPYASSPVSMIDARDVGAVAATLLTSGDPSAYDGQKVDLTGPAAITVSEVADVVSTLRPRPIACRSCSVEEYVGRMGLPPQLAPSMQSFFETIGQTDFVSDNVHKILGRPPRSAAEFVHDSPLPFLPAKYTSLVGKGKDVSFRAGASVVETDLEKMLSEMKDDEVFLKVLVAGVNGGADSFSIINAAEGETNLPLGFEGVGRVVAVGDNVTDFVAGDLVSFVQGFSAFAEYTSAPASRCQPASDSSPLAEFVALRVSALTASVALRHTAGIKQSDVVLVTAACGGTGSFAVQIAKLAGATVIGTVGSAAKVEVAKSLGCDRVVNYREEDLGNVLKSEFPDGIDIVYDGVGGSQFKAAYENLAEGGRILIVGAISTYPHNASPEKHNIDDLEELMVIFRSGKTVELPGGRRIIGNIWGDSFGTGKMVEDRQRVTDLHAQGKLRALIAPNQFKGVSSVPDAVDYMLSGQNIGKVWVQISE